jgi:hypothetical protein
MRWEFDGKFVEIADGTISGDEEFIHTLAYLVEVDAIVFSPRLGPTFRVASFDDQVSTVCTVEWLLSVRQYEDVVYADLSDWDSWGEIDGPGGATPVTDR